MKQITFLVAAVLTLVAIPAVIFLLFFSNLNHMHQYETQQICDRSHMVRDGNLEQTCGVVQARYNTEYLCNSTEPDAVCWVEVK